MNEVGVNLDYLIQLHVSLIYLYTYILVWNQYMYIYAYVWFCGIYMCVYAYVNWEK